MGPKGTGPRSSARASRSVNAAADAEGPPRGSRASTHRLTASSGGEADNVEKFRQLFIPEHEVKAAQTAWSDFLGCYSSHEVVADAVYGALFESMPILQSLFTQPQAIQAMKFTASIGDLVNSMAEPASLLVCVEMLGFQHLQVQVTIPRVAVFKLAILQLLASELGKGFNDEARKGLEALLDYAGEAIVYVRTNYAKRIQIIAESWAGANGKVTHTRPQLVEESSTTDLEGEPHMKSGAGNAGRTSLSRTRPDNCKDEQKVLSSSNSGELDGLARKVPSTFTEMFHFSATVMGYQRSARTWMLEVLDCFDALVSNLPNSGRVQEECDVLTLRLSKCRTAPKLSEFRACMLASLRSLLPKHWTLKHEEAWTWMWDNVSRILEKNLGKPPGQEAALEAFLSSLDGDEMNEVHRDMYGRFFELAPTGQDYFKQSNTRLNFIANQVVNMTMGLYRNPKKLVTEISALGLRHVGFGIPTDLFAPFVTGCCQVVRNRTSEDLAVEGFRWSLAIVSKILVRTILEGSTVVMKAINANSCKQLKHAIDCAPRAHRAGWLLHVQVGDQHISPLSWAIESGSLEVADLILKDLLTIRADRKRYYYGAEELFARHGNVVKLICEEAPMLLPTLFDGLIWRSHRPKNGMRRLNAYLKYVLVAPDGQFSDSLKWVSASGDPVIVSHPIIALLAETLWNGVVLRQFIYSRIWNIVCLLVFVLCQEVLPEMQPSAADPTAVGVAILVCRLFNYLAGMGRLLAFHLSRLWLWCRDTMRRIIEEIDTDGNGTIDREEMVEALRRFRGSVKEEIKKAFRVLRDEGPDTADEVRKSIANKDKSMYNLISFALLLLLMLMCLHEPLFWCAGSEDWPTADCTASKGGLKYRYSIFSMSAMVMHWLILIDLAVFSTEISAFLLVCGHVLGEVKQFLTALAFLLLLFGSSISIMCRHCPKGAGNFSDMPNAIVSLFAITVGLYQGDYRDIQEDGLLLFAVFLFVLFSVVLLLNLLIAQLNRSYEYIYKDMLGFARLNRASLIVEAMASCPKVRWEAFVASLRLDERLEFDEGDLGLPGGIQVLEPAGLHRQTVESIRRFGGSSSEDRPWPEDKMEEAEERARETSEDRLDRIEALIQQALQTLSKTATDQVYQARVDNKQFLPRSPEHSDKRMSSEEP